MDKTIKCKECGKEFTFTANEQQFYLERGFVDADGKVNEPVRCKDCRDAKKNSFNKNRR